MAKAPNITSLIRPILWESDLEANPDLYCPGIHGYDWDNGTSLDPVDPWIHEAKLEQFFSRDPGIAGSDPDAIMILLGGIGTGKSTSVRRAINRASATPRHCSKCGLDGPCATTPRRIVIDFKRKESATDPLNPDAEIEETSESEFWTHVQHCLEADLQPLSSEKEFGPFWSWCLDQASFLDLSPTLSRALGPLRAKITFIQGQEESFLGWSRSQVLQGLQGAKERFYSDEMKDSDRAWYSAYKLAFSHRAGVSECRCAYLFLDNVDHLSPQLQRISVDVAIRLSELIPARTIIAVRPLTWERSFHGHYLINTERHRSPDIHDVIKKRVAVFIESSKEDIGRRTARTLLALQRAFGERNPLLRKLVDATSGLSVRWALRNFHNLLESPAMSRTHEINGNIEELQISDLARAYLCGERRDTIPQSFDNLYNIQRLSDEARWLVKPRILDILFRRRSSTQQVRDIFNIIRRFDCDPELFLLALNELMLRKRPLVWCNVGTRIDNVESPGRLSLTPIGCGYVKNLFGEVFYDEHTLPWEYMVSRGTEGVWEFHRKLTERDLLESKRAKNKYGARFYFGLYPAERPSLSFRHAENLMRGLPFRLKRDSDYDPERVEWVRQKFLDELGPAPRNDLDI